MQTGIGISAATPSPSLLVLGHTSAPADPYADYTIYDSFTGSGNLVDHDPEKGGPWTVNGAGTFTLSGGKATMSGAALSEPRAFIDGGANGTIVLTTTYDAGLLVLKLYFNYLDSNNYWYVEANPVLGGAGGTFALKEVTSGSETNRGSGVYPSATTGATWTITINGDTVSANVGAVTINYTSTGARPNKTAIGLQISCFDNDGNSAVDLDLLTQTT